MRINFAHKRLYVGLGSTAILLTIFGLVADEVVDGGSESFDTGVLMALRAPDDPARPIGPHWLLEATRDVTALGSYSVLTIVVVAICLQLLLIARHRTALFVLFAVLGGTTISTVLKQVFDRPRPELTGAAEVFTASFPSGHAMMSAVTFLTIGTVLAANSKLFGLKIFYIVGAIFLALVIGISRIYLGVHYPTDVIAGWCLGGAWALLCYMGAELVGRREAFDRQHEDKTINS